jgi:hypothetical protein
MDTLARYHLHKDKQYFLAKVNGYTNELQILKSKFQQQLLQQQANSNSSTNSSSPGNTNTTLTKLHESTAMLEESRRHLHSTHLMGDDVLNDMEAQKEILLSSHSNVKETSNLATQATTILSAMQRRHWVKKLCLYSAVLVLAAVIALESYYGIIEKHIIHKRRY